MPNSTESPVELSGSNGHGVTPSVVDSVDTKPCPICGELIKSRARKCVHCDSALDWRKFVGLSSTTLAILTALIAVIGQSTPAVRSLWDVKNSRLHFTFISAGGTQAVLQGHIMTGDVVLLATNDGSRAGAIVTGRLIVGWTSEKRQHFMSSMLWMPSDEPQIVGPGTAVIARLFIDPLLETELIQMLPMRGRWLHPKRMMTRSLLLSRRHRACWT